MQLTTERPLDLTGPDRRTDVLVDLFLNVNFVVACLWLSETAFGRSSPNPFTFPFVVALFVLPASLRAGLRVRRNLANVEPDRPVLVELRGRFASIRRRDNASTLQIVDGWLLLCGHRNVSAPARDVVVENRVNHLSGKVSLAIAGQGEVHLSPVTTLTSPLAPLAFVFTDRELSAWLRARLAEEARTPLPPPPPTPEPA